MTPEVEATAEEQVRVGERWLGMKWMRKARVEALLNRLSSTRSIEDVEDWVKMSVIFVDAFRS